MPHAVIAPPRAAVADESRLAGRLTLFGRIIAIALGAMQATTAAFYQLMNPDGIAYLDIADAYMRGDFQHAINTVWSPLYSLLLGPAVAAVRDPIRWEFPVVHAVNLVIYLVTLVAFEFFWTQVVRFARSHTLPEGSGTFPLWTWTILGYALFVWVSIALIGVGVVTPDLLMSALVYLAAGLIIRVRVGSTSSAVFAALGVVLGLAFLSKTVMFTLAPIFIAVAAAALPSFRLALSRGAIAVACFLLVAGPFVILISRAEGRFTIGEAGHLTYIKTMNGVPYPHWQGDPAEGLVLEHPSRKILDEPPIYEFGAPVPGTYPIGYDPSHWYEGVDARFEPSVQFQSLWSNLRFYVRLFLTIQLPLVLTALALYGFGHVRTTRLAAIPGRWGLAIVAFAALGAYGLVLVESRYIGTFLPLLWGDLLAPVRLPASPRGRNVSIAALGVAAAALLLPVAQATLVSGGALASFVRTPDAQRRILLPTWPDEVASALHDAGVGPGSKVGVIGYAFESYWARLAGVQIVSEMFGWEVGAFWTNRNVRLQALCAFARNGARAVVAEHVRADAELSGWHRVGSSYHYIYVFGEDGSVLPGTASSCVEPSPGPRSGA